MTKITVLNDRNTQAIRATGHATGSVSVCNGVSAILYALAGWLTNNGYEKAVEKMDAGEALILCTTDNRDVKTAFEVAVIGLLQLEKKYSDYIVIKEG